MPGRTKAAAGSGAAQTDRQTAFTPVPAVCPEHHPRLGKLSALGKIIVCANPLPGVDTANSELQILLLLLLFCSILLALIINISC